MTGFCRLASASPLLAAADTEYNLREMERCCRTAREEGAALVLFPALSLTGCGCGDLFHQELLLRRAKEAAAEFARRSSSCIAVFGFPLTVGDRLYSMAAVARNGRLCAFVPLVPAQGSVFSADFHALPAQLDGVPCGTSLRFDAGTFVFEIVSEQRLPQGAALAVVPGAGAGRVLEGRRRKELYCSLTRTLHTAALAALPGTGESSADEVGSGYGLAAADGVCLAERKALSAGSVLFADVDFEALAAQRRRAGSAEFCGEIVPLGPAALSPDLAYASVPPRPFLPADGPEKEEFCEETLELQRAGVCCRWERSHAETLVLGVSGGLDSTLALLVLARACEARNRPLKQIIAVTMPGFGTTDRTYRNAVELCRTLGVTLREIPIREACLGHFRDIGHDPAELNAVYENAQARERTQILMDVANQTRGIVIGTGDLSELALGWCTYNGDQMSMYGVNASVPKSVIPALLEHEAVRKPAVAEYLLDVIRTPVSPELLPAPETGDSTQKTEGILGAYELHDFFLWHMVRNGSSPEKILLLAERAFAGKYPGEEILRCLKLFLRRFFQQQFKRSASPDGVQTGEISLSPRGSWRMPSDLTGTLWQKF